MDKNRAKQALFDIIDILEKYNIRYFLFFGTLLGAIKEKDFIDGDNDIDLGILDKFWENTNLFKNIAKDLGDKKIYIGSIMDNSMMTLVKSKGKGINIDLYYGKLGKENTIFNGNTWRLEIPNNYFLGLDTINFLGRDVKTPKNPSKFIDKLYMDKYVKGKKSGIRYGWMVVDKDVEKIIEYSSYLIIYGDKRPPEKILDNRDI